MSERDKVMSKRDEIRRYLIAVFGQPMDSDHERQLEAHIECAELWGDYYHAKQNAEAEKLAKLEAFVDGLTIAQNQDGFTLLRFKKSAAFYKDDVHFDGETPLAAIYAYLDKQAEGGEE